MADFHDNPMFSRRHYEVVARIIQRALPPEERYNIANRFAAYFKGDNPRFDHDKFFKAVGVV